VTKTEKKDLYGEFKLFRKDLRQIEQQHINQIFKGADVICSTLTSGTDKTLMGYVKHQLQDSLFDILVIDECAQSIEPACWIPIQFCKKLVMAGDHK
jgi:ATP-dependent RNA/DNA helicase IGHMBP2